MKIVSLHPIEATKDKQPLVVQDNCLVESPRRQRHIKGNAPSPGLKLEIVLMDVVKTLQSQVNATENVHGGLGGAGGVAVSPLDVSVHLPWLKPDARVQIEN